MLIATTVGTLIFAGLSNATKEEWNDLKEMWQARLYEMAGKNMESPGRQAIGHILVVTLIASGIGATTAQVSQLEFFQDKEAARFATTAILPIALSASVCIGWHRWVRETFETVVITSWILSTFHNPGKDHIELNLPTPETYLIIAATASAGASITLQHEGAQIVTAISATVGGLTSGVIASASPRVGAIVGKKKLRWQTEREYTRLLGGKPHKEQAILRHQGHKCKDCHRELKQKEAKFGLIDREANHKGNLDKKHLKAVCKDCAVRQPTMGTSS